ncbi:hypothetical protein ACSS6W_009266 [Trichoderma asperelloides]
MKCGHKKKGGMMKAEKKISRIAYRNITFSSTNAVLQSLIPCPRRVMLLFGEASNLDK